MTDRIWVLGAPDPEMKVIESILRARGERVEYATVWRDGVRRRVTPAEAYAPDVEIGEGLRGLRATAYMVECAPAVLVGSSVDGIDWAGAAITIDHHRPGDPGYGRPPKEFFEASSIGQVLAVLGFASCREDARVVLAAAADHCLAAAYRGECPGVDPDALMRWRVEQRAANQGRSVEEVLADVERAREALMDAPVVRLSPEPWEPACGVHGRTGACWQSGGPDPSARTDACYAAGDPLLVVDMRGQYIPELPEAAAREGVCFIASLTERDGRIKVVCQSGTPEQIEAFMRVWAPAQGLVDVYGDYARGFAGGHLAT